MSSIHLGDGADIQTGVGLADCFKAFGDASLTTFSAKVPRFLIQYQRTTSGTCYVHTKNHQKNEKVFINVVGIVCCLCGVLW